MRGLIRLFLLAVSLSACAEGGGNAPVSQGPDSAQEAETAQPFPALEAESVLAKGFQAIAEFSLEEIELSSFALEGIKGLGALDPNLVAKRDGDRFQLFLGERKVYQAKLPARNDPRGWARLAVEGLMAARETSPELRKAGSEQVYQAVFDSALARFDIHSRYAGVLETKRLRAKREGQDEDGQKLPPTVGMRLSDHVALIQVVGFNEQTAAALESKLKEARETYGRQWKGLILDLRGNPGGLLEQAVESADLFLNGGRIVATRGRHPMASLNHEASEGDQAQGVPIVVLVDGRTASGGEILAAALQDRGRAVVVGSVTYGKGLVQTVISLPNGGEIDLSWSRFLTPSGYALQGLGVLPNVCTAQGAKRAGLAGLLAQGDSLAADFAHWRTIGIGNLTGRQTLRSICPPEDDDMGAETVARSLLADHALFAKALAPTGAVTAMRP